MVLVFVYDCTGYVGTALVKKLNQMDDVTVCGSIVEGGLGSTKGCVETALASDLEQVNALIMKSDAIVYAAEGCIAETKTMLRLLKRGGYEGEKKLVVVSSLLTWGSTKIPEEGGLAEENFNSRKCPARYKELKTLETHVKSIARENLSTTVVGAGLLYGGGENTFHGMFRSSWMDDNAVLPILSGKLKGENKLPTLDVNDLGSIICKIIETTPESPYVVAVDKSQNTMREIVTAISTTLGSGKTKALNREETQALLMDQPNLSSINANLVFSLDGGSVEGMGIEWKSERGMVENIEEVVKDYKLCRDLRPMRIVVMGAPHGLNLNERCKKIASDYYVPFITVESAKTLLMVEPEALKEGEEEVEDSNAELRDAVKAAGDNLPLNLTSQLLRFEMKAKAAENKGWLIGGNALPFTWKEACGIFSDPEAAEGSMEEDAPVIEEVDEALKPTGVILFDGSDEYLKEVAMGLPDDQAPSEEDFTVALASYRGTSSAENDKSPATFFESLYKMDSLNVTVTSDTTDDAIATTVAEYVEQGSKPFNYHPTEEEVADAKARADADAKARADADAKAKAEQDAADQLERKVAQEEEKDRLAEIKRQEMELLEARSQPLRRYLMKNVIPSLTEGLIETCKVMPEDPIDYLAEYLFKVSPAIDSKAQGSKK
jgi:adenylate kinase